VGWGVWISVGGKVSAGLWLGRGRGVVGGLGVECLLVAGWDAELVVSVEIKVHVDFNLTPLCTWRECSGLTTLQGAFIGGH